VKGEEIPILHRLVHFDQPDVGGRFGHKLAGLTLDDVLDEIHAQAGSGSGGLDQIQIGRARIGKDWR
jgi:hypothetical protein